MRPLTHGVTRPTKKPRSNPHTHTHRLAVVAIFVLSSSSSSPSSSSPIQQLQHYYRFSTHRPADSNQHPTLAHPALVCPTPAHPALARPAHARPAPVLAVDAVLGDDPAGANTQKRTQHTTAWPNAQAKTAATQSQLLLLLLLLLGRVFAPRSYPGGGEIIAARQFSPPRAAKSAQKGHQRRVFSPEIQENSTC